MQNSQRFQQNNISTGSKQLVWSWPNVSRLCEQETSGKRKKKIRTVYGKLQLLLDALPRTRGRLVVDFVDTTLAYLEPSHHAVYQAQAGKNLAGLSLCGDTGCTLPSDEAGPPMWPDVGT